MSSDRTIAVINDHLVPLAVFAAKPDMPLSADGYTDVIRARIGSERVELINATVLATRLMGDSITANIFLLGYAYQRGAIPLTRGALFDAIRLNGISVEANQRAFSWGRVAAAEPDRINELIGEIGNRLEMAEFSLDDFINNCINDLTAYQNSAYADRFRSWLDKIKVAETGIGQTNRELEVSVARSLFKLMAYKDEYEVARLYCTQEFRQKLKSQFDGDYRIGFNFAPPLLARMDPVTGHPRKTEYSGKWMRHVLVLLSRLKFLRGTPFDPFGYHRDRQLERQLIADYESHLSELLENLRSDNINLGIKWASLPQNIRGYGHVKHRSIVEVREEQKKLRSDIFSVPKLVDAAE